ncbi:hypothetical protein [Streptomyces sp. NPDC054794]
MEGGGRPHRPRRARLAPPAQPWHTVLAGGLQPESIGDIVTRAVERAGIEDAACLDLGVLDAACARTRARYMDQDVYGST